MEEGNKGIKEKISHWKVMCEDFLNKDIKVYIKDIYDNIYFADIIYVGEDKLAIQCFAPEQRHSTKYFLNWFEIYFIKEYKERGDL